MRFKGLDLNLLTALDALLHERNVSAAGRRVFLSQSAMSGALARLRDHFGDQLLQQVGRRMILTPFAEGLIDPLHQTIRQIELLVSANTGFDPAHSQRRFAVIMSDYLQRVVLPHLAGAIAAEAPAVTLEVFQVHRDPTQALDRGEVDLVVAPEGFIPAPHIREFFYEEDYVVAGWAGNPTLGQPLSQDSYQAMRHVVVRFEQPGRQSFGEREVDRFVPQRSVAAVVHSFTAVPLLLVGTQNVAVMHRRLAHIMSQSLPLACQELPVAIPRLRQMIAFHPVRAQDAALDWLKSRIRWALDAADNSYSFGR